MATPFSGLMQQIRRQTGEVELVAPEDWRQGRAIFGGLQTVLCLQAMRTLVPDIALRTLQTTFVAPPASDRVRAVARVLRQGKSATHVEAHLLEGESVLAVVLGVFGAARPSIVSQQPRLQPVTAEQPIVQHYMPGFSPTFTQHFSATWLRGGLPYSGAAQNEAVIEIGMPGEAASSEAHVVALADFIPPLALSCMTKLTPGSSLTWMLEFLTDQLDGLPMQGWRVDAKMVAADAGYTSQSAVLFSPAGQAIALSRQSMVVFG